MELKMQNLSLQIKCSFSKINSAFFCPAFFYSTFISTLLKVALQNFKRMLLENCFDGFFHFFSWFFKVFLLHWFKNLRAQLGLYQKGQGSRPTGPSLDAHLKILKSCKKICKRLREEYSTTIELYEKILIL